MRSTPVASHFFSSRVTWSGLPMAMPSGGSPASAGPAAWRRRGGQQAGGGVALGRVGLLGHVELAGQVLERADHAPAGLQALLGLLVEVEEVGRGELVVDELAGRRAVAGCGAGTPRPAAPAALNVVKFTPSAPMPRSAASSSVPGVDTATHIGGWGFWYGLGSTARIGIEKYSPSKPKRSLVHIWGRAWTNSSQLFFVASGLARSRPARSTWPIGRSRTRGGRRRGCRARRPARRCGSGG